MGVCWPLAEAPWLLGGRGHQQSPWPSASGWRLPSAGISVTDAGSQRPLRHNSDKQQMLKGFVFPPGGAARALVYCGQRGLGLTDQWCPGLRLAGAWVWRPALLLQTAAQCPRGCTPPRCNRRPAPCSPCPAGAQASCPRAEPGPDGDRRAVQTGWAAGVGTLQNGGAVSLRCSRLPPGGSPSLIQSCTGLRSSGPFSRRCW